MTLSTEILLMIAINIFTGGLYIGGLAMAIKFIEKQLSNLEEKQDKHNSIIERTFCVEESSKSAHKRLDDLKEDFKEIKEEMRDVKNRINR